MVDNDPAQRVPNETEARKPLDVYCGPTDKGGSECVDERPIVGEELRKNHIKLPGGSIHIVDMFEIAFHKAGIDNMNLPAAADGAVVDAARLVTMTKAVHESEIAKSHGFEMGVHNDDEHGHITDQAALDERDEGCGHDRVRRHSLFVAHGVQIPVERANLVGEFKKAGAKCVTYSGNHLSRARAAENYRSGQTLHTQEALDAGDPAFDSDVWIMRELAGEMAKQVRALGGVYEAAADLMTSDAVEEWSHLSYQETLRDLGGPADNIEVIR